MENRLIFLYYLMFGTEGRSRQRLADIGFRWKLSTRREVEEKLTLSEEVIRSYLRGKNQLTVILPRKARTTVMH